MGDDRVLWPLPLVKARLRIIQVVTLRLVGPLVSVRRVRRRQLRCLLALLDRSLYVDRLFGRRDDVRPRPERGDRCGDAAGIRAVDGRTRATVALEALVGTEGGGEGAAVALEASKVLLAMDDTCDGCGRPGGGCCRRDRCCVGATRGGRRARGDHRNVPRRWGRDAVS